MEAAIRIKVFRLGQLILEGQRRNKVVGEPKGADEDELPSSDHEDEVNVNQDDQDNDNVIEGYESGDDPELPFRDVQDEFNLETEVDNIVRDSAFHVQPDEQIRFFVGQTHDSVYTLRHALVDYAIQVGFIIKSIKNEPGFIIWRCAVKKFPWAIHASTSKSDKTMTVQKIDGEHSCLKSSKSKEATSS